MSHHLTVIHEFGSYKKGDKIFPADEIEMVLASPQHPNVVRSANWEDAPAGSTGSSD